MINPFLNPVYLCKSVKSFLFDVNRINRMSPQKLKRYQDKALRKAVKHAYTVPLYHKKYKEHGVHPRDIKGIDDLHKLPLITKDDIRNANPDDIIPKGANIKKFWKIKTAGSTGNVSYFYRDSFTVFSDAIRFLRVLKLCGINWRKDRTTHIGAPGIDERYDHVAQTVVANNVKSVISLNNFQELDYFCKDLKEKVKQIDKFRPDYIIAFPGDLQAIASLKKKGYGKHINPKVVSSCGGMLDDYTRKYIEAAFQCKVIDVYGSVEMGYGACQCKEGNYHLFSDYIFFEFLDKSGKHVLSGKPGLVAITRLSGKGTPFIRYTGMEDILTPIHGQCPCGLNTSIVKSIGGRTVERIVLPNGKFIASAVILGVFLTVLKKLRLPDKVAQFQIIQDSLHKITILIVLNNVQRDGDLVTDTVCKEIKKHYYELFDKTIEIEVKSVKQIVPTNHAKPAPIIVSKLHLKSKC